MGAFLLVAKMSLLSFPPLWLWTITGVTQRPSKLMALNKDHSTLVATNRLGDIRGHQALLNQIQRVKYKVDKFPIQTAGESYVADGVSIHYQVTLLPRLSQFEYLNIMFPNHNVGKYSQS